MVLDHIPDRSGLIVEGASPLDPEVFRHGDLDALDLVTVPERLQERVREAKEDHVMHRPLPKVMVDAEDGGLVKDCEQSAVKLLCRGPVVSERLFDNNASVLR